MLNAFYFPAEFSQAFLFLYKIEQRIVSLLLNYRFHVLKQIKEVQSFKIST